jgi:hypothetical protein
VLADALRAFEQVSVVPAIAVLSLIEAT